MLDRSTTIMSIVAGLCSLLGLFLASRAVDTGFAIFGWLLALFGLVYIFTAIRRGRNPRS